MKKLNLKMWTKLTKKVTISLENKVIKLREERSLITRFLLILGSRPQLVPKLEDVIGKYEMSIVPRSLAAVDGSLYLPTDKSYLMKIIEGGQSEKYKSYTNEDINVHRVLIVDAMEVLQSITKTPKMKRVIHLQEEFIARITNLLKYYEKGRIVFDRYLDQSLKNKTRNKRAQTVTSYAVHPQMTLNMSIKELLSSSSTKRLLTNIIAKATLEHFAEISTEIVIVYDDKIVSSENVQFHTHEEADQLIPHQILACQEKYRGSNKPLHIDISSPDTDVLILCVDLVSNGRLSCNTELRFITGKNTKNTLRRVVDVKSRVNVLGKSKAKALIGFHNFTGADWGGKFVGISKQRWCDAFIQLPDESPVLEAFSIMGQVDLPQELQDDKLPPEVASMEAFVCTVYSPNGPKTISELRWELFRTKNSEGEMLPPTCSSLLPHIMRVNFISRRDKSYTELNPSLPPLERNGWQIQDGVYSPLLSISLPAPKAVIELTKCSCKKTACLKNCSCYKNGLTCTPICKCNTEVLCENIIRNQNTASDDCDDMSDSD